MLSNPRVLVIFLLLCSPALAKDHFLTIGGGGNPQNNQMSLERNVAYFQRVLQQRGLADAPHDIYFACGKESARDLQFIDPKEPPRVNVLLSRLYSRGDDIYQAYRPHQVDDLDGPATRAAIGQWFAGPGAKLAEGDRLFVYFTGHGSGGKPERNTTMDLWQDGGMPVKEFTGLLDKLNPKVAVVLVMVQCHSGGFADVIFKDASAGAALSAANRCGFFATWHSRLAAGCTPDTAEENYREYSTYFWAAISGKTRKGDVVTSPDYDGDGKTSLAEAHAYVHLTSETIDIPVATSDVFLRQFSKTKEPKIKDLVTASLPFEQLLELATPDRKAALEGLSKQLALKGDDRAAAAKTLGDSIDKERKALEAQKGKLTGEREPLRRQIRGSVQRRWPEMNNPWHPAVAKAITGESAEIVKAIESNPGFKRWEQLDEQIDQLSEKSFTLERKWVKCQRFLYLAESAALAANLEKCSSKAIVERYNALREAECGFLGK